MDDIIITSRYGDKNILRPISKDTYVFIPEYDYMRVGYDNERNIHFIDPSGGPFMSVDSVLPEINRKIKQIKILPYDGKKYYALIVE